MLCDWQEVPQGDGKKPYYWNKKSGDTTWDKPGELYPWQDGALDGTPWQRSLTGEGKPYYFNPAANNITTWDMPEDVAKKLKELDALTLGRPAPPAAPQYVAGAESFMPHYDQKPSGRGGDRDRERDEYRPERRDRERDREREDRFAGGDRPTLTFSAQNDVKYSNPAEAEAAFTKVLKRLGVQSDWDWPQTVRAGVKDPEWRALPEPTEREAAFKKYCDDIRAQDKEREIARQEKVRTDFTAMLRTHPEIKYYTRWKTALPFIKNESIFRTAKDDNERRQLFEEYIVTLKEAQQQDEANERRTALEELSNLLKEVDIEPFTRWHDAEKKIHNAKEFDSPNFRLLERVDLLTQFEAHIRLLQQRLNTRMQAEKHKKHRLERKNRDAYRDLLAELTKAGQLKAGSKWKDIHGLIKDDPRYLNMLGQNGSTPLDLFWDALSEEDSKFRSLRRKALDVLEVQRFEVMTTTTFEEFDQVMRTDLYFAKIKEDTMRSVYNYVLDKVRKREEDERNKAEHHERKAIDDLRSVFKHLEPAVSVSDTWEEVRPRVEKYDEFQALKEPSREAAFDKYIRRLKEKEAERRDRRRDPRDRDSGRDRRDRDREYRNGHSDSHRRPRTRTRSPEQDAYEAERKKAQLDREARYRHDGSTGLSPPYRRDRDNRYDGSRRGSDHYVRERREREVERERLYVSRADPRDRVDALDYGDDRGLPSRRRRDSDGESSSRRDAKRPRYSPRSPRRDRRSPTRTPAQKTPDPPIKVEPGLRSGSEEGEIEED
ncbi:hypothetical protein BDV96DRAFT_504458 [Lophiotrema nucula]|uniref:Uncharacterized protein n=1 Tax=Lophiotrema nucula TaxID=690887 RepID=A0A6A5YNB4_9PLEO|nr:hypothetical protein BDV96DRAFT_504458 [Lophiotrema nucula]